MADVIDIITRLSYDANTESLQKAYEKLQAQLVTLVQLSQSVQRLEAIKKQVDDANVQRITRVNNALEAMRGKFQRQTEEIRNQVAANDALRNSLENYIRTINRVISEQDQLKNAVVKTYGEELRRLNEIRDALSNVAKSSADGLHIQERRQLTAELEKQQKVVDGLVQSYSKLAGMNPIDYSNVKEGLIGGKQSRISALRGALPFANTKEEIAEINRELQTLERELTELQSIGRRPIIQPVNTGLSQLNTTSKSATFALTNLNYIIQDLPFGFLGISNNINPLVQSFTQLSKESGGFKAGITSLLAEMAGPQGLFFAFSTITTLLLVYGDKIFGATKSNEEFAKSVKSVTDNILNEIDALNKYYRQIEDVTNSGEAAARRAVDAAKARGKSEEDVFNAEQNLRSKSIDNLKKDADQYRSLLDLVTQSRIDSYKDIQNLLNNPTGTVNTSVLSIFGEAAQKAKREDVPIADFLGGFSKDVLDKIEKTDIEINDKKAEIDNARITFERESKERHKRAVEDAYKNALQRVDDENTLAQLNDQVLQILRSQLDTEIEINKIRKENRAAQGIQLTPEEQKIEDEEFEREKKRIHQLIDLRTQSLSLSSELQKSAIADKFGKSDDSAKFQLTAQELDLKIRETKIQTDDIQFIPTNSDATPAPQLADKIGKDVIAEYAGTGKKGKDKIDKGLNEIVQSYRTFAQTIIGIISSISDRQIALLDREIQIRQDRVAQATELAEKGNIEILRSEQERLDEAQKKREEVAQKQLQLNAIIQVSNQAVALSEAIGAVVKAAAEGDPYTIALRVAAAVAALIAGVTAMKSAFSSTQGFKDGVIDLRGEGNETSDSIPAKLSRGESVMTAKETRQYKDALLAMRSGEFYKQYIPVAQLANPVIMPTPVQSKQDYKSLEKRLDALIELQQNNGISVHTGVTNGHIATIVESQRKFEQRRWS